MEPIISIKGLGKSYRIRANEKKRYRTLREDLTELIQGIMQGTWGGSQTEEFWALKDIDLDIYPGEVVGVVGRNGAGKSTLLKILSRVVQPTTGEAVLYGRVASLLEVGTGFHSELTGRENIFMSGTILGMKRNEIIKKFDEIVAFAEVEKFLETPVKRYSSGMYVRLAFAVAAHLEPEILIVDEVLAVGDMAFQKKCLGRMKDVAVRGRTVLFVSHNIQAINSLCSRAIMLDNGKVITDGKTEETLSVYTHSQRKTTIDEHTGLADRLSRTSGAVRFTKVRIIDADEVERWNFEMGETVRFHLSFQAFTNVPNLCIYMAINSSFTGEIITTFKKNLYQKMVPVNHTSTVVIEIPNICIRPGEYSLYICLGPIDCHIFYDVIDQNVSLPDLMISSGDDDQHRTSGYVSIPANIFIE
ncbi:ABC transporter ATP-binding protein [Neosynechococcus sphagnicola]|uniref:ABC transporter ATP-binding protein n=1 Tax=Neosynechococcus sphagnicola TaxID=1501145 RepID=UPI00068B0BD1|nr:ABC transporter ATP-binding protein [Neosynechococcus sphagnicola]